jgi:biopolymer transport protein ExbD
VTPLVDVVLVLLIIFLVTMPILMRDIALEIPRKSEDPVVDPSNDAIPVVELGIDGTVRVDGEDVSKFQLTEKLGAKLKNKREKVVFVGFEDDVKYGEAVEIMDLVKGAGAEKVALKMKDEKAAAGAGGGAAQPAGGATP